MNILLIGSGGREHALAMKIMASPLCQKLYAAPGNPGMAAMGADCVTLALKPHSAVTDFCAVMAIDLVVIGPEAPLVDGLADSLNSAGIKVFGPSAFAAQLEGSKAFTKAICDRMAIPTARYAAFTDAPAALEYVRSQGAPIVIKADGLAAGKGVVVAETLAQAEDAVTTMFDGAFGDAGTRVVIEECLIGEEASAFFICDGERARPIGTAQDHKRAYDGDKGPNTGGMGAYSPAPVLSNAALEDIEARIAQPTLNALKADGHPYVGILYVGLMMTADGPKLIEFNCRFGDPECQVLMMRLTSDLVTLMLAACDGAISDQAIDWQTSAAVTVVLASEGYPERPVTGREIKGLDTAKGDQTGVQIFHAGTRQEDGQLVSSGGRVLNITVADTSLSNACSTAYSIVEGIALEGSHYRKDIAWRALHRN